MDKIIKQEPQETTETTQDSLFTSGQDFFSQLHTRLTASEAQNRQNEQKIQEMERKLEHAQQVISSQNHQLKSFNQKFDQIERKVAEIAGSAENSKFNPCRPIRLQMAPHRMVQRGQFVSKRAPSLMAQKMRSSANSNGFELQNSSQPQFPLMRVQAKPEPVPETSAAPQSSQSQHNYRRVQQVFHFGVQNQGNDQKTSKYPPTRPRPY